MEVEEEEVEDWYDVDQPNVPNTHVSQIAPRGDLSELYHRALVDFKRVTRPESQPASHADAQEAYNARSYKAFYHIPIGDQILNMDEGEHAIQVNSTAIQAVLDPQLNYNLITHSAQTRTRLNTISIPPQGEVGEHTEDIAYCAHVLIELSTGPLLPGMFLLTEDHIPGGYDLVLGKPWMMGVEHYFAKHRFKQSQPTEDTLCHKTGNHERRRRMAHRPLRWPRKDHLDSRMALEERIYRLCQFCEINQVDQDRHQ